jgi:hypothetical protein
MTSEKPTLEKADKVAIAVAVAFFFVFSGLLMNESYKHNKKQQAAQVQKFVKKAKNDNAKMINFNLQHTK